MAWELMYRYHFDWYKGYHFEPIDVPVVFDQKTRKMAVEAGRLLWADITKRPPRATVTGENWKSVDPEVIWREPLEKAEDSQSHSVGGVAQDAHQPDETAEYEEYRISG